MQDLFLDVSITYLNLFGFGAIAARIPGLKTFFGTTSSFITVCVFKFKLFISKGYLGYFELRGGFLAGGNLLDESK